MKLHEIYFPGNVQRSSHYMKGLITGYCNSNKFVSSFFKTIIICQSILHTIRDIRYCKSLASFRHEFKDTYAWSLSIYELQCINAQTYYWEKERLKAIKNLT